MTCTCGGCCCQEEQAPRREVVIKDDGRVEGKYSLYVRQPYGHTTYTGLTFRNRFDAEHIQRALLARWAPLS